MKGDEIGSGSSGAYYRLTYGPGEPHIVRTDMWPASTTALTALTSFVHFTDIHLVDAQSPSRVEFLDRFADTVCETAPLNSAFRPQETMTVQVLEAMVRSLRAIRRGPVSGRPLQFLVCTGDNIDNEQYNELRWFIDTLDGGKTITPNSGDPSRYEGVQAAGWADEEYWHPDNVTDKYKDLYGFLSYPGLLKAAIKPFRATGIRIPWWQTFGNHDGLLSGNVPRHEVFNLIAVGPSSSTGRPTASTRAASSPRWRGRSQPTR